MTKQGKIENIKDAICAARAAQIRADKLTNQVFELLDKYKVNLDIESNAENSDILHDAICCYIDYNEYNLDSLLCEISKAMNTRG